LKVKKYFFLSLIFLFLLPYISGGWNLLSTLTFSRIVKSEKGELLRFTLASDEKYRLYTGLDKIPQSLIDFVLTKEDRFFYYHPGFNPYSLLRALSNKVSGMGPALGASTISMQLARLYFGLNTKSSLGKVKQLALAYFLEIVMSKNKILEAYLNLTPYGRNIEGVGAASLIYFKKLPAELKVHDQLLLSIVPQRPGLLHQHLKFAPAPEKLEAEKKRIFSRLTIYRPDFKKWEKMISNSHYLYGVKDLPFGAPHFSEFLLNNFSEEVLASTLRLDLQKIAEKVLQDYVMSLNSKGIENASALLIDHQKMEVVSYVGSVDYFNSKILGQVDGLQAKRSPGSTLKPFAYALAFDQGLIHAQSILYDAPQSYRVPENFDYKHLGPVTAENALILSRNVPAVVLSAKLKNPELYDFLKRTASKIPRDKLYYGDGIVLGGLEMSPFELASLYTLFPNYGELKKLKVLKTEENVTKEKNPQLLSKESSMMIMDILSKNPRPDFEEKYDFVEKEFPIMWKSGTSIGFRDAWALGIYQNFTIAVWVGNFDGRASPHFVGTQTAAPLFYKLTDALRPYINSKLNLNTSLVGSLTEIDICPESGKMRNPDCPYSKKSLFISKVSPIHECRIHRKLLIDPKRQVQLCREKKAGDIEKVYEIWPSHLMRLFSELGMPRSSPPPYAAECLIGEKVLTGEHPLILSPKSDISYRVRASEENKMIKFEAKVDSEVKNIFWYLGNQFLGKKLATESFFWEAKPGKYLVRLVDDKGRETAKNLQVYYER
jgi:penicillin-binding protein 1C